MSALAFGIKAVVAEVTWGAIRAGMASTSLAMSISNGGSQAVCVDLLVDKTRSVGQVCVTDRNDTLFVRFQAADGWHLAETHLAVGASREEIPLAAGRHPVLGLKLARRAEGAFSLPSRWKEKNFVSGILA